MTYPVHPLAEIFPMLPEEELSALAESIAANGLRHAVLLAEAADPETGEVAEMIVDGRNRLAACKLAGIEPRFERLNGVDVGALILAENVDRRNLNAGQRAMARAMLTPDVKRGGVRTKGQVADPQDASGQVSRARFVLRHDPTLAHSVMSGAESLNAAYETARQRVGQAQSAETKLATIRAVAPDLAALVDDGAIGLEAAIAEFGERQQREREAREAARRAVAFIVDQVPGHVATILAGMQLGEPPPAPDPLRRVIGTLQSLLTKMEERP